MSFDIEACCAGEPEAVALFWQTYEPSIRTRVSHTLYGTRFYADVDDVVNEVYIRLFDEDARRLRLFRGESTLKTFIVVLSGRVALKYLEKHGLRASTQIPVGGALEIDTLVNDPGNE